MRKQYLKEYIEDRKLMVSLDAMHHFALFKTTIGEVFPFVSIFIRQADRTLYHSSNVWFRFISDLNVPVDAFKHIPDDAVMYTQDQVSKYEIEAYLGAAKTLFEKNLSNIAGGGKQNLLGSSFARFPQIRDRLKNMFTTRGSEFFKTANRVRNHAYHVNPELKDIGVHALLKRVDGELTVTIPNVYLDAKGVTVDLADLFISTHKEIGLLIHDVRDVLLEFYFQKSGPPSHGTYYPTRTPFGTMNIGLGPNGFEFSDFHETEEHKAVSAKHLEH